MPEKHALIPRPVSEYDLRLLRIFKVVVDCGGFAAAESVLNITRSTISVHMSNLETRMNVKLARRGRGGFSLTEQGKAVYDASLVLFRALNDFATQVQNLDTELQGEISILCSDQVALTKHLRMAEVIRHLQERAPNVQPAINADTIPNIEQAILNGEADIGIIPEYRHIDGLSYRHCYSEAYYLCVGNTHPLFHIPDQDIRSEVIYRSQTVHPGVEVNLSGLEQLGKMNLAARAYQFETRAPLVLSGLYLGFFPLSFIQPFIDRGEIRLLQPGLRFYNVDHVLVTRHGGRADQKVDLFLDAFTAAQAS